MKVWILYWIDSKYEGWHQSLWSVHDSLEGAERERAKHADNPHGVKYEIEEHEVLK